MAKKSAGASEINGFIAVTNNQPKTSIAQKASSSSSKPNDVKLVKASTSSPAIKKVPSKVNKVDTKSNVAAKSKIADKPAVKTTDSKNVVGRKATVSKDVVAAKSNASKTVPAAGKVQSSLKGGVKTSGNKTVIAKTQLAPGAIKKEVVSRQATTKSVIAPQKPKEAVKKSVSKPQSVKTNQAVAPRPVTKTKAPPKATKPLAVGTEKTKVKLKADTGKAPLKPKPSAKAENVGVIDNNEKVLGKSGLSFDITLEPAKAIKPREMRTGKSAGSDIVPPPLVKQRTFVKDEEDEEVRNSLPHIVAPDELNVDSKINSTGQYEEDDFEEYESDFEERSTDTESSYTDLSARKSVEKPQSADDRSLLNRDKSLESAPSSAKSVTATQPAVQQTDYNYEDDFEDYSSDFEEDTESGFTSSNETSDSASLSGSVDLKVTQAVGLKGKLVEEEKKLDSGNYDLKTTVMRNDVFKPSQLNYIKEAISHENIMFKDGMPVQKTPSPPPLQIMDFKAAIDKTEEPLNKQARRIPGRGKILLSMIKLHEMAYDIFEMQPMSYEDYIKLKGNSDNAQEETQTGDDNLWEESQTDEIIMANKWTQCPVAYHSCLDKDWRVYLEDKRGHGSDDLPSLDSKRFFSSSYNAKRLENFVASASQVMTVLLEEEASSFKNTLTLQQSDSNLGFSDGYVPIYCDDIDFLKDRIVTHLCISPHFANIVVTCYNKSSQSDDYLPDDIMNRWLICLWDMITSSQPLKILIASAPVESLAFDCLYSDLIYAGLTDGLVCLWDLNEPDKEHNQCRRANFETIMRTPTFCSYSSDLETKETHTSPVICMKSTSSGAKRPPTDAFTPTTLFSLSSDGKLLIWTVIRIPDSSAHSKKIDIRISPWGRVRLALISVHQPRDVTPRDLRQKIDFLCLEVKQSNSSILLGTNMGFVLQYPLTKFKTHIPGFGDKNESLHITEIELCPHDSRVFLVGVSDGSLRLHSDRTSRPIKIFSVSNLLGSSIASVKWSSFNPGLIVTLDNQYNLLVWNLCQSDLQPVVKMSFKGAVDQRKEILEKLKKSSSIPPDRLEKIVNFMMPPSFLQSGPRLSRMDLSRDIRLPYLGIVISGATVHVHRFSHEFAVKGADIKNEELKVLQKYLDNLQK